MPQNNPKQEAEPSSKMDFGVSFSVTSVELQQSRDMKLLEHLTEKWSRELGLAIGKAKRWDMYPNKPGGIMTKTLQVRVYTHDELMEFADAMRERGRQEEMAHTTKLLNEQLDRLAAQRGILSDPVHGEKSIPLSAIKNERNKLKEKYDT